MSLRKLSSPLLGACLCVALLGAAQLPAAAHSIATGKANGPALARNVLAGRAGVAVVRTPCAWLAIGGSGLPLTDSHAYYWLSVVTADPGATLTVTGTYPAARYASIQAYSTAHGVFLDGLADKDLPPDAGFVNPFAAGTQRGIGTYTAHVVFGPPPTLPVSGTLYVNVPAGSAVSLVYRIYLPDSRATTTGNVALPTVTAYASSSGAQIDCPQLQAPFATATTTPSSVSTVAAPSPTATATGVAVTATPLPTPGFVRATGQDLGGYGNVDAAYLVSNLAPAARLYVIRFKVPTTPHTLSGGLLDTTAQLRYWSLCVYFATSQPYTCLLDEQVPTNQDNQATIVLGPWWARPSNATLANGIVWISLGWFTTPYFVILRQLLPAAAFTTSVFAVPHGAGPSPYMGAYAPTVVRCTIMQYAANNCAS